MPCIQGLIGLFRGLLPYLLQLIYRKLIMLGSSFFVPFNSLVDVLIHSKTFLIAFGKVVLCFGFPLLSSNCIPPRTLGKVFFDTSSRAVAPAKILLRFGKIIFCSLSEPLDGLFVVAFAIEARLIIMTHLVFG